MATEQSARKKTVGPHPRAVISQAKKIRSEIATLLGVLSSAQQRATEAYKKERARAVRRSLSEMPIEELKKYGGNLRLTAVKSAGLHTVGAAQKAGLRQLEAIRGVGPKTSTRILAAAREMAVMLRKELRVRFNVDSRPAEQRTLLSELRAIDFARRRIEPLRPQLENVNRALNDNIKPALLVYRPIRRFFAGRRRKEKTRAAFEYLTELLSNPVTIALMAQAKQCLSNLENKSVDVWDDYLARNVAYNGLLIEIGRQGPDPVTSQGFLPEDIVARVNNFDLDKSLLRASLRGYQAFGAKFALVQKKTILGDEMGLGKTVEALAVICHLSSQGATHFFVVCPASVLANWEREIWRHSRIHQTWRLHGAHRAHYLRQWARQGGVAITTFGTLGSLDLPVIEIAAVVIDEAHYVKNPEANRTKAVRSLLARSEHRLLMSGTPMENRVEEFRELVNHIQRDIAEKIRPTDGIAGADAFRKTVAPVYLRRNQDDVLNELPKKIEVAEWLTLDGRAADLYRQAVGSRNFMAMRRAAFMTERPSDSPKLNRLLEIAEEAMDNHRKVIVFSFFRKVINRVHAELGRRAVGPLTGSVSATNRQLLVDQFSRSKTPGVLVSQIEAGGIGLNIQAASVVILTEPQWKPSTEDQAIARCHRMGQVRPVEVHRLLTENSVDEHMVRVLHRKSALFAQYVRKSSIKDAAPEAIDVTDDDHQVVSQVEQERRIIEIERRRLGFNP